jgi:hypothetical protein
MDAADRANLDGFLCSGDAVYVNGRRRPARNKLLGVDAFYDWLYDRFSVFSSIFDLSGRETFRVLRKMF